MRDLLAVAREFCLSRATFHVKDVLAAAGEPDTPANCTRVEISLAAIARAEDDFVALLHYLIHKPDEADAKIASVVEALRTRGAVFSLEDVLRYIAPPFLPIPAWEARERVEQVFWGLCANVVYDIDIEKLVRYRKTSGKIVYRAVERANDDERYRASALLHEEELALERIMAEMDALSARRRAQKR